MVRQLFGIVAQHQKNNPALKIRCTPADPRTIEISVAAEITGTEDSMVRCRL
jgi:hypothetical protein